MSFTGEGEFDFVTSHDGLGIGSIETGLTMVKFPICSLSWFGTDFSFPDTPTFWDAASTFLSLDMDQILLRFMG